MAEHDDPRHNLRLTPALKAKLAHAAIDSRRSVNAEILTRLERSFEPDPLGEIATLLRALSSLGDDDRAKVVNMLERMATIFSQGQSRSN